ncbi:DUF433 domain-containing protein [Streptomyces sp. NPDC048278]|uniref:DUF433 domain-containing protein n=1 Tax=Streptomyces sp. NPDC048278 TaxID=3155809 RepID=UPI0034464BA2
MDIFIERGWGDLRRARDGPRFGHGLPVVAANRVTVRAIIGLWEAGEAVEDIAYDYDMTPEQVDALCQAVVHLAA